MTEEQQEQLVEFLALFARMLKEGSAARDQAELVLQVGASCMIAAIFHLGQDHPEAEMIGDFARRVIRTALTLQYEPQSVKRVPLQA